ncbi:MAG: acyl-CoA dehydrogenase family protein [Burkholderiaceae bacterium]|nr:acyl-CoA dehydrogenase family protein [Burkholderiaceae bacterium]
MALTLDDSQRMLLDSARSFIGERAPIAHLRKLRDSRSADGFDRGLWREFAEMGFAGVLVPEAQGGMGLGLVEAGIVMETIGRTLMPSPFFATAVLGARAFMAADAPERMADALSQIASGRLLVALAVDEAPRHRPHDFSTRAHATADGAWRVEGDKTFVVDGHIAQTLIVAAQVEDGSGIVLLLVDPAQPGVQVERTVMVDAHNSARVRLNGVGVASDRVLVGPARGAQVLEALLDAGRAVLAAELVGAGDEVFARTLAYLKERKQFGKTIGEFQALQHRAAVLLTDLEMARAAVMKALQAAQAGGTSAARWVSVAKAKACAAGGLAAQEGVQMHGGMGMTDEFDMGLFMKRVRVLQELFGDASFHGDRLARIGGY